MKAWRRASTLRQMSRTAADGGSFDQEVLDDAVFQRMKRHHHQAATRLEHPLRRRQRQMQFVQLLIDENTQSLKRSRRRVNFTGLGAHYFPDDIGERTGGEDRRFVARGDNGSGNRARMTLFAEDVDDIGEIGLGSLCDDIRGGRAVMAHPHVERTTEPKRKTALGLVELHRGHPNIHDDAVDRLHALASANFGKIGKPALDQRQSAARPIDEIEPAGNRRAVTIDADDTRLRCLEDRSAITAGPERGVDKDTAVPWRKHIERFAAQDGNVTPRGTHARPPGAIPVKPWKLAAYRAIASQISRRCRSFRLKNPVCGALAGPGRPKTLALKSRCNVLGCHGISSVKWGLGRPPKPVGCSSVSNGSYR